MSVQFQSKIYVLTRGYKATIANKNGPDRAKNLKAFTVHYRMFI